MFRIVTLQLDLLFIIVFSKEPKVLKTLTIKALFAALEGEEDYIEAPNLLSKINLYFT